MLKSATLHTEKDNDFDFWINIRKIIYFFLLTFALYLALYSYNTCVNMDHEMCGKTKARRPGKNGFM